MLCTTAINTIRTHLIFVMGVIRNFRFGLRVNGGMFQPAEGESSLKGV